MKKIRYFIIMFFMFFVAKNDVFAGSLSVWASASNITVGQTVTISVKVDNLAGKFNVTSSNQSILSGGANGNWLENDTYTFVFTAKSAGKVTVTATAIEEVGDFDTNGVFTGSKSVSLNVVEKKVSSSNETTADKKEYSSDNNLSSLSVDGYQITPEFNKDITEYQLTVDESIEKVNILAKTSHEKASITGTGEVMLSSGENTIEVKVIAENGNEKIYKIMVTVEDKQPIKIKIGKEEFTVVRKNNHLIDLLEEYEETTIKINDQDVVAYVNSKTNVTLVLLKNKDNKIAYYVYNQQDNTYKKYHSLTIQNVTIQLLEPIEELINYQKYSLKIQDQEITYYKIKNSHKVGLIYGTNVKTGNTGYYVYDQNEETLSKYFDDEVKIYQKEIRKLKNYLMVFMGIVSFIVIVIIVASLRRSKKRKKTK